MYKLYSYTYKSLLQEYNACVDKSKKYWTATLVEMGSFRYQARKEDENAYIDVYVDMNNMYRVQEELKFFFALTRDPEFFKVQPHWEKDGIHFVCGHDGKMKIVYIYKYEPYDQYLNWCASWDEARGYFVSNKKKRIYRRGDFRYARVHVWRTSIPDSAWELSHGWDVEELTLFHRFYCNPF